MKRIQLLLSLFLVFHLAAIAIAPNKDTYLGTLIRPVLEPYINFFEFAPSWNFFAPDPATPLVFLEWELLDEFGRIYGNGSIPQRVDPFLLRERQNRTIALTRFLVYSDERIEQILGPWLCRKNPDAGSVRIWKVVYTAPGLREVSEGKRKVGDDKGVERRIATHHFCSGARR